MSTLIVQLPFAPRLTADPEAGRPDAGPLHWVLSPDGVSVAQQGQSLLAELPAADAVVAVLAAPDVSWHRVAAPKAPAARLRAALAGLLEEALLDEAGDLHLAVAPGWKAGEPGWVAAVAKPWLSAQLDALAAAGRAVDRLVPALRPQAEAAAHVLHTDQADECLLAWQDDQNPTCLPVGAGTRAWLAPRLHERTVQWSATPDAARQAAELAGDTVAARSTAQSLVHAAAWDGNLLQFDLTAQRRGSRWLREAWRRFWSEREWRPVRWGLLALLAVQLLGVNLWAWQQRQALSAQKAALIQLLQGSFPQVRAVIDPPLQMQKEVERLRMAAGRAGDTDLEPMLQAVDAAWPASRPPASALRFEPGQLTVGAPGWSAADIDSLQRALQAQGLDVNSSGGQLVISRNAAPGASR